jgi:hypothetical protein
MGRSYLSIGLAAIFGLLVAGFVAAAEYARPASVQGMAVETRTAATMMVVEVDEKDACGESVTVLVHIPRATAHAPAAIGAGRI